MSLQPITNAPQPNLAFSRKQTGDAGVAYGFEGEYNETQMAKYNNEFNYWLWQQQAQYNSPAEQMQRAKEAGLNPNVIAGNVSSGNLSNIPHSNGRVSGNAISNRLQLANVGINSFNALLKAIGEGVDSTSKISGIPDDISTYRYLLTQNQTAGVRGKLLDNILKNVEQARLAYLGGASPSEIGSMGLPSYMLNFKGYDDRNFPLWEFKDSQLKKMWDAFASTPEIANRLKESAIQKNDAQISLTEQMKILNEFRSTLTEKQLENFDKLLYFNMINQGIRTIGSFF